MGGCASFHGGFAGLPCMEAIDKVAGIVEGQVWWSLLWISCLGTKACCRLVLLTTRTKLHMNTHASAWHPLIPNIMTQGSDIETKPEQKNKGWMTGETKCPQWRWSHSVCCETFTLPAMANWWATPEKEEKTRKEKPGCSSPPGDAFINSVSKLFLAACRAWLASQGCL